MLQEDAEDIGAAMRCSSPEWIIVIYLPGGEKGFRRVGGDILVEPGDVVRADDLEQKGSVISLVQCGAIYIKQRTCDCGLQASERWV